MTEPNFVYHVTTMDRAELCLAEGIFPYRSTACSKAAKRIDHEYDAARPKEVKNLNVTRQDSVYAHPDYEHALARRNGGWLNRVGLEVVLIAIDVPDLTQAYVCDGLLNVAPYDAEQYWSSFTTLANYRSREHPTYLAPNKPYSNKMKRFMYMWPEVLLPNGVKPDRLSLVIPADQEVSKTI